MAQHKANSLDFIQFENVSFQTEGFDPTLRSVDLDLPMDQTVLVKSSNPSHAVQLLEILAGRKAPQSGKVRWSEDDSADRLVGLHEVMGCYFESNRPDAEKTVMDILKSSGATPEILEETVQYFELTPRILNKKFRLLNFETQKLIMLLIPTLKTPQLLILEDPAVGLTEKIFLDYLDWIQMWQRQGHLRHIYLTNNHPTASRHLQGCALYVEDGLIYVDEDQPALKKIVHF